MELYQKFQVVQFLVILCACIIGTIKLRKTPSPERKYILTFCYIDLVVLGIGIFNYLIHEYPTYLFLLVYIYTCCEVFFLSYYISTIINKKVHFAIPLLLCITSLIFSLAFFKSPTILPLLTTELYLTFFAFLYIRWLFTKRNFFILQQTRHYWIVMGIILSYTASIPYWIGDVLIKSSGIWQLHIDVTLILFIFYVIMNTLMFVSFIKAFLCKQQQHTSYFGVLEVH
ncbi:hypothetical protein BC349_16330 [Flavihumibacter stibioxidans]|uniref:YhhN-like protein n=1 Tax=Flavihumibacter stibioxidans TaxID=1834163 RepID=A0ABR7MC80_9BACT|nr:hypothetical protein [Flavihumibacter stibioxidans]